MIRPNENPLIPASLEANGIQGADASAVQGAGGFEHTAASANALLRLGVMFGLKGCDALASLTDDPALGIMDACGCINAAAQFLSLSAEFSGTEKSAHGESS